MELDVASPGLQAYHQLVKDLPMTNLLGEFFGTMMLITFGAGVVACVLLKDSKGNGGGWIVITTGWALAVMLGVFTSVALGAPQADLNPAVTLAKTMLGTYGVAQAIATMPSGGNSMPSRKGMPIRAGSISRIASITAAP